MSELQGSGFISDWSHTPLKTHLGCQSPTLGGYIILMFCPPFLRFLTIQQSTFRSHDLSSLAGKRFSLSSYLCSLASTGTFFSSSLSRGSAYSFFAGTMRTFFVPLIITSFAYIRVITAQGSCQAVSNVHLTNYGFPDASGLTQYSCNGDQKADSNVLTPLGSGTYSSPYSAALSNTATAFKKCETIYIPYFRKYFKFSDICAACGK